MAGNQQVGEGRKPEGTTARTQEVERRLEQPPRAMQGAIAEGSTPSLGTNLMHVKPGFIFITLRG